jgi:hypothetical protein
MKFEMSETQQLKLEEWQEAIGKVYGKKGDFEFTFKPNGMGYSISVYSELANFELDLNENENW